MSPFVTLHTYPGKKPVRVNVLQIAFLRAGGAFTNIAFSGEKVLTVHQPLALVEAKIAAALVGQDPDAIEPTTEPDEDGSEDAAAAVDAAADEASAGSRASRKAKRIQSAEAPAEEQPAGGEQAA